jgi:aflatoxin B1 aldehyde reductase
MNSVKLVLGTMTFGPQVTPEVSEEMVRHFLALGHCEIDAAYVYNEGDTERILGVVLDKPDMPACSLATKVNPRITGKLDEVSITAQLEESLRRMRKNSVDILYLHFPDPSTDLEETLAACAKLHERGLFRELGMSNFPAWQAVDAWHICKARGWPTPTVYQGLYNGLSRKVEAELFPALRELGMRFYAYNPLAGGILAGKHAEFLEEPEPGRFTHRPNYKDRYWKESFFAAMHALTAACEAEEVSLVAAAFRWLAYHSALDADAGDGILIGASRLSQLEQNIKAIEMGPLPESIGEAFEVAWGAAMPDSPDYFRVAKKK